MAWMQRIRGLKALLHDVVDLTADLVREGFDSTARSVRLVTDHVQPIATPVRTLSALVQIPAGTALETIKAVNRTVQRLSDTGLEVAQRLAGPQPAIAED